MSYKNAKQIFPEALLKQIQHYAEGEYIYIPRKHVSRRSWGENTPIRTELQMRNTAIYSDYLAGTAIAELADNYCLSDKSIQRIVLQMKRL